MGAIIVSIFVSVVACVGGIYFYIQDHILHQMQDHSHHVQELHEVGFFLILGRSVSLHSCAWCSVRSSLHTSGAHLTAALQGANRCGGNAAPYTPFYPPALISKTHS